MSLSFRNSSRDSSSSSMILSVPRNQQRNSQRFPCVLLSRLYADINKMIKKLISSSTILFLCLLCGTVFADQWISPDTIVDDANYPPVWNSPALAIDDTNVTDANVTFIDTTRSSTLLCGFTASHTFKQARVTLFNDGDDPINWYVNSGVAWGQGYATGGAHSYSTDDFIVTTNSVEFFFNFGSLNNPPQTVHLYDIEFLESTGPTNQVLYYLSQ